jgi:hypothetical protein
MIAFLIVLAKDACVGRYLRCPEPYFEQIFQQSLSLIHLDQVRGGAVY